MKRLHGEFNAETEIEVSRQDAHSPRVSLNAAVVVCEPRPYIYLEWDKS